MKAALIGYMEMVRNWYIWKLIASDGFFNCVVLAITFVIGVWFTCTKSDFEKSDEYFIKGCEQQREVALKLLFDFTTCASKHFYGASPDIEPQRFSEYPCEAVKETIDACVKAKSFFEVADKYASTAHSYTYKALFILSFLIAFLLAHGLASRNKMNSKRKPRR